MHEYVYKVWRRGINESVLLCSLMKAAELLQMTSYLGPDGSWVMCGDRRTVHFTRVRFHMRLTTLTYPG
jgi:hypothetical protein